MSRIVFSGIAAALLTVVVATPVLAQTAQRPTFATTKVDGTDNVYIFPLRKPSIDVRRYEGGRDRD